MARPYPSGHTVHWGLALAAKQGRATRKIRPRTAPATQTRTVSYNRLMIHDAAILDVAHAFAQTLSPSSDAEWLETAKHLAQRRGDATVAARLAHWLRTIRRRWGAHRPPAAESRNSYLGGDS